MHVVVYRLATLKADKNKINAEDTEVDALLAQAEYIFNNADEFINVEEMEMVG